MQLGDSAPLRMLGLAQLFYRTPRAGQTDQTKMIGESEPCWLYHRSPRSPGLRRASRCLDQGIGCATQMTSTKRVVRLVTEYLDGSLTDEMVWMIRAR
jgi:hypothetical protein